MREQLYAQCLLSIIINKDFIYTVAWIPAEYAVMGKTLKIKDDYGNWRNGWVVDQIYSIRNQEFVLRHERDWVKQRQASDI